MKKRIHEFLESMNIKFNFKFGVYGGEPHQAGKREHSLEWSAAARRTFYACLPFSAEN